MRRKILSLTVAVAVGACATGYQSENWAGGFAEMPLAADTYQIQVKGNGFTSASKTNAIAMVRAAELTLMNGYKRFIIMDFDQWTKTTTQYTGGSSTTTSYGSATAQTYGNSTYASGSATSYTNYNAPTAYDITKPRSEVVVKFVAADDPMANRALLAEAIILQYGPKAGYEPKE